MNKREMIFKKLEERNITNLKEISSDDFHERKQLDMAKGKLKYIDDHSNMIYFDNGTVQVNINIMGKVFYMAFEVIA